MRMLIETFKIKTIFYAARRQQITQLEIRLTSISPPIETNCDHVVFNLGHTKERERERERITVTVNLSRKRRGGGVRKCRCRTRSRARKGDGGGGRGWRRGEGKKVPARDFERQRKRHMAVEAW